MKAAEQHSGGQQASGDALATRIARALELRDAGHAEWLAEACADAPELQASVAEAVRKVELLPSLYGQSSIQDTLLGCTLADRFVMRRRSGAGAMGVVYLAEDLELGRSVAVKVLRHGLMDVADSARRFEREAEAMASVVHPSVITIHDRGATPDGAPFLVMEFIDGLSLGDIIDAVAKEDESEAQGGPVARRPMPSTLPAKLGVAHRGETSYLRLVVRWALELAEGLEAVHRAGVLHRDIKPSNVLVRRDGRAVLLDFGIALLDSDSTLTRGASSIGTPIYMPPEAVERGRDRTAASDVYSLAATLHHLVALRAPYKGAPNEVLAAIATRDPIPANRLRQGVPRDLQAILDKGMQRRPKARYASAEEFADDLRKFLAHAPVSARPITAFERGARRLVRSKLALGAILALSIMALVLGVDLYRGHRETVRRAAHFELFRRVPPNFAIVGPANAVLRHESDRADLARLLERLVATADGPLPSRLLRAAFLTDHGDPTGAARDLAEIARWVNSDYSRALAAAYRSAAETGSPGLILEGLPRPVSIHDRYLAAFHALRADDVETSYQLLDREVTAAIPHAEELRINSFTFTRGDTAKSQEEAIALYTATLELQARLGGATATTRHLASATLDVLCRYDQAFDAAEESIALAPRYHTNRINAGFAAFGLGRLQEAEFHLNFARDLRPNYAHPAQVLIWVLLAAERFDDAQALVATSALDDTEKNRLWRLVQPVIIETWRAVGLRRADDREGLAASLARAVELRDAARSAGAERALARSISTRILDGLLDDDADALFVGIAKHVASDPHQTWWLGTLLDFMPDTLSGPERDAVGQVFEKYLGRLAPKRGAPSGG